MSGGTPYGSEGGALYLVATPIGSARDITLRALDVLASADVLAAEDTRVARKLLDIHGIALNGRPLISYHDHNGPAVRPKIIEHLTSGRSVAFVSDAGTPMVADPGYRLVGAAIEAGHEVHSVPGASAVLAALTIAGLPTDRFLFSGFLPAQDGPARSALAGLRDVPATLVFFETPQRLERFLTRAGDVLGSDRPAAICRELTKKFEEVYRGTLRELKSSVNQMTLKGEIVVVIGYLRQTIDEATIREALSSAMIDLHLKDAASVVAKEYGWSKRDVYQLALEIKGTE